MTEYVVTLTLPVEGDSFEDAALNFAGTIADSQDWQVHVTNVQTGEEKLLDIEYLNEYPWNS